MTYPFDDIIILYNPNSTGGSRANAERLAEQLREKLPEVSVQARGTEYAGHAEALATEYAQRTGRTLLISSSGDGGYNEVVNGVVGRPSKNLTVAVLPSGNANDHYHATAEDDNFVERVLRAETRHIDVLEVRATQDGQPWQRYAHSYIGIGLTAYIGKRLTEARLNPLNEKWLVAKYLMKFGHVTLRLDNANDWRRYSNVIASNIDRMSKLIKLADDAAIDDGEFELYTTPRQSVRDTIRVLVTGAMTGLTPRSRHNELTLEAKHASELQCDGEVFEFDGGQMVTIRTKPKALKVLA